MIDNINNHATANKKSKGTIMSTATTTITPSKVRLAITAAMQHRVLIYATCYNVLDGVTLTIRKLEQEILAAGHHVCILTTTSGDMHNTHLVGMHPNRTVIFMDNAIPIPFLADPEHPEQTYSLGFSLSPNVRQQIDDFEPSIIHITVPDCTTLHVIQYARSKEIPIMGTYHSNIPEYMDHYPGLSWLKHILGAFFRHQYNFLQALYVPTPFIQRHLTSAYKMDKVTTMAVWGRGVDVQTFHPDHRSYEYRRQYLGIADDVPVVLWVGRLVPEKRPDIFAHVIQKLHSRGLKFHALVVGAGPVEEMVKKLPNTTFAGWMNAEQLSTAYASSDIFLFPSAVETFGNVTLEAAASGLPVIVESGCSGHLVHDGENGFACADEDAFFEATLALVEDAQMREEFSASSREMALTLEKTAVVRTMLDHYSRVTDEFYTEYSGRHANRDWVYTQPDSFLMSKYTRPMILVFVEYLFLFLFQILWRVSIVVQCVRQCVSRRPPMPASARSTAKTSPLLTPPRRKLTEDIPVSQQQQQQAHRKVPPSSSNNMSVVELDDVEIGKASSDPLLSSDDNTATTGSSNSQDSGSSSSMQSFGDCRLSHALAKVFISTVQFQCRLEGHVRNFVCSSGSGSQFRGAAKRKNSSMAVSLADLNNNSSSNDASEYYGNDEISPSNSNGGSGSSSGLQSAGNVMRRGQSSAIDVY